VRRKNSDYSRGKADVQAWAYHWTQVYAGDKGESSTLGKLVDYGQPIHVAFTQYNVPEHLLTISPPYIREIHAKIMDVGGPNGVLSLDQREAVIVWHFGTSQDCVELFGASRQEPSKIKASYKLIGRNQ